MTSIFDLMSVSYFSFLKRRNFSDHIVQLQFSHRFCLKDRIQAEGKEARISNGDFHDRKTGAMPLFSPHFLHFGLENINKERNFPRKQFCFKSLNIKARDLPHV